MSDFPASDLDDELEIKKRARRRLVGAAALALLAAIVLPLAMRQEAPEAVPDMQVSIPERDIPQAVVEPDPGKVDIEPDVVPGSSGLSAEVLPVPPVSPAPAPLPLPPEIVPERPVSPPVVAVPKEPTRPPRTDAEDAEAARVLALLNGTEQPERRPAATQAKGRVFVQVGAFGDAAKAVALASELKKQGFAAYTEKSKSVTRVRIGPLSRSEGEQIAGRLKAQGRKAVLLAR